MAQVFQAVQQPPSVKNQLGQLAGTLLGGGTPKLYQHFQEKKRQQQENRFFKENFGVDTEGVNPELKNTFLNRIMQRQPEKSTPGSNILGSLDALENLVKSPGIGLMGSINPSGKARFNRGEFQAITASILPLFKSMFPRGFTEKEFKFIQDKYIPRPSDTEETIKGKIKGLRELAYSSNPKELIDLPQESSQKPTKDSSSNFVMLKKNGKQYRIPKDKASQALKEGFSQ